MMKQLKYVKGLSIKKRFFYNKMGKMKNLMKTKKIINNYTYYKHNVYRKLNNTNLVIKYVMKRY